MANDVPKSNDNWVPHPWSLQVSGLGIKDLIGRKVRVSPGPVTMEIEPGRVTVLVDGNSRITDIYVDPDGPTS